MSRQVGFNKYNHIIAMLLMAVVFFMPLGNRQLSITTKLDQSVKVAVQSPCQQSKVNQTTAGRLCQSQAGSNFFYCLISDFVMFFQTITGKIAFLFILGMISTSFRSRPYKPPRFIFA